MQTISPPLSAEGADNYYDEDYQAKSSFSQSLKRVVNGGGERSTSADDIGSVFDDKIRGEWHGSLKAELSLPRTVSRKEFRELTRAKNTVTGEQMIRSVKPREKTDRFGNVKMTSSHRAGWDITFSASKSVSLAALVGGDARIIEAHRKAVGKSLEETAKFIEARMGNTKPSKRTGKCLFAVFLHDMARPDKKSGYAAPDLHSHAFLFNFTKTDDGKYRAVQPYEMFANQKFATAIYRAELARNLKNLGYKIRIDEKTGAPEIEGISRAYIEASSPRQTEIKETAKELGVKNTKRVAHLNRPKKNFNRLKMRERQTEMERLFGGEAQAAAERAKANENQIIRITPSKKQEKVSQAVGFAIDEAKTKPERTNWRTIVTASLENGKGEIVFDEVKIEIEARRLNDELKDFDLEKRITSKPSKKEAALTKALAAESAVGEATATDTQPNNELTEEIPEKPDEKIINEEETDEHNKIARRTSARAGAGIESREGSKPQNFAETADGSAGNSNVEQESIGAEPGAESESKYRRREVLTESAGGKLGQRLGDDESARVGEPADRSGSNRFRPENDDDKYIAERDGIGNAFDDRIGTTGEELVDTAKFERSGGTGRQTIQDQSIEFGAAEPQQRFGCDNDTITGINVNIESVGNGNTNANAGTRDANRRFDEDGSAEHGDERNTGAAVNRPQGDGTGGSQNLGTRKRESGLQERTRISERVDEGIHRDPERNSAAIAGNEGKYPRIRANSATEQSKSADNFQQGAKFRIEDRSDVRGYEAIAERPIAGSERPDSEGAQSAEKTGEIIADERYESSAEAGSADKLAARSPQTIADQAERTRTKREYGTDAGEIGAEQDGVLFSKIHHRAVVSAGQDGSAIGQDGRELSGADVGREEFNTLVVGRDDVQLPRKNFPVGVDTGDSSRDSAGDEFETRPSARVGHQREELSEIEETAEMDGKRVENSEVSGGNSIGAAVYGNFPDASGGNDIELEFDERLQPERYSSVDDTAADYPRNNNQIARVAEFGDRAEIGNLRQADKFVQLFVESERPAAVSPALSPIDFDSFSNIQQIDDADERLGGTARIGSADGDTANGSVDGNAEYSIIELDDAERELILDSYRSELNSSFAKIEQSKTIDMAKSADGVYVAGFDDNWEISKREQVAAPDLTGDRTQSSEFQSEQFAQSNRQAADAAQQQSSAAIAEATNTERQFAQQIRLTNQLMAQFPQAENVDDLLDILYDQQALAAQNHGLYQQNSQNPAFMSSSDLRDAKENDFWKKEREQREAQIALEKAEMRAGMSEEERNAYDQSQLEEAEAEELNDEQEMSRAIF